MKIAFITGARSDYGPFRSTLKAISQDDIFDLTILAHGMHFLELFGNSINELKNDNYGRIVELNTLETNLDKCFEFTNTVDLIYNHLKENLYHLVIVVGDRLESYAASLAAHFAKIPVLHSGGGHLTRGAVDNIYRYNISNLATYHLTTSKKAYATLKKIPIIDKNKLYFTGSATVDAIKDFLVSPISIENYIPALGGNEYTLMTFHPVTLKDEPIIKMMKASVEYLLTHDVNILITYPNNDDKSQDIITYIKSIENQKGVYVMPHLGSMGYYSAIYNADFVVGNSSSGIMEVPYLKKYFVNVGSRQDGRALDRSIINVDANVKDVIDALSSLLLGNSNLVKNEELYGDGTAVEKTTQILHSIYAGKL
jgi:UDP-hydrolysing UDP-N-acetyl-D-glucosamine 2-epimerase